MAKPLVSVIIPCRNEENFIGQVLKNVIEQDYPSEKLEVFVLDGQSSDNTAQIIEELAKGHSFIHYLENEKKTVPFALNKGIKASQGEVIIRMDAHCLYPKNYISLLVEGLFKYNCDNTGGLWLTSPGADTEIAKAIASATSHPLGIGNAHYRLAVQKPRKVDTVPFGCYKREVFDKIGLFDEELTRNQDDEFNARLVRSGGSIYLLPEVKIKYFARENFSKMSKMFYQYGLFKPLVNKKVGAPATIRQFAPITLLTFFIATGILSFFSGIFQIILLAGALTYLLPVTLISIIESYKHKEGISFGFSLLLAFPIIHFSYGWGYLEGVIRFVVLGKTKNNIEINR
ncbi:MAG: glycosyltransferase family 2 protein [Bacteroidales bacterium]|nr:glycosyltransferase family 2 protein [Bacteroidales bacterium]MCF8403125.1 glycosyltransferase family 2 protein [Bacteroidales bacterium]